MGIEPECQKHAVFNGSMFYWLEGKQLLKQQCMESLSMAMLTSMPYNHKITHVWLMPECKYLNMRSNDDWRILPYLNPVTRAIAGATVYPRGWRKKAVHFIYAKYTSLQTEEAWIQEVTEQDLLIVQLYLERKLPDQNIFETE